MTMIEEQLKPLDRFNGELKDPDEHCPLPYIQLDCTTEELEEYFAEIGAISLEDFMKKVSDKYDI